MRRFLILGLILAVFSFAQAQDFEVPEGYKSRLKKAEDYAQYEEDILSCVAWLGAHPVNMEVAKRKDANKFLITWIEGAPKVTVVLHGGILTFADGKPDYLVIFMGGWTAYSIKTEKYDDQVGGNVAGLEAVIDFYVKNKSILGKNKEIEKYVKLKEKGKLEEHVKKTLGL